MTRRSVGTGTAIYCGFLPGLSYFKPATPLRPPDRGTTDLNSAHFIPVDFDPVAAAVVSWPTRQMVKQKSQHTSFWLSDPLVDARVVLSSTGAAVPMSNWRGKPIVDLTVNITASWVNGHHPQLASGGPVQVVDSKVGHLSMKVSLDIADAIVLRSADEEDLLV